MKTTEKTMKETEDRTAQLSREEIEKRLAEAEHSARVAASDIAILKECIVRMALERYGVLNG